MEMKYPVSLEVISVGPQFRELDYRWLEDDIRKPVFSRIAPLFHGHSG